MRMTLCLATTLLIAGCNFTASTATPPAANAQPQSDLEIKTLASGFNHPWAVALLPDGTFLVTERSGSLRHVANDGSKSLAIKGVPKVFAQGQGGLLDVVLAPDFATSKMIYLSYAEPAEDGTAGTAVARGVLNGNQLDNVQVIYRQEPKVQGGMHFGSRIAFDDKGHIFISQGERNQKSLAQDLTKLQGKLVRLNLDGSIPNDNPFVGKKDARAEIFSYGHRNMQGMTVDPRTGKLWQSEHGPKGGDEINLPQPGRNYGWPLATHGMDYSTGRPYPETKAAVVKGLDEPYHMWPKSPALSGMAFFVGHPGHAWNESLFLGSLVERNLIRLTLDGDKIVSEERLLSDQGKRIRDVRVGPDGTVYVVTDEDNGELISIRKIR